MKAKEYLERIWKHNKIIENRLAEVEQLHMMAESTTAQIGSERVQSSGSQEKMADAVCRLVDAEKEIDLYISQLIAIRQEVINTIEQLPLEEYDILHKRYIQGMTSNEIASINGKTYTWVKKQHKKSLEDLQKILDSRKDQE